MPEYCRGDQEACGKPEESPSNQEMSTSVSAGQKTPRDTNRHCRLSHLESFPSRSSTATVRGAAESHRELTPVRYDRQVSRCEPSGQVLNAFRHQRNRHSITASRPSSPSWRCSTPFGITQCSDNTPEPTGRSAPAPAPRPANTALSQDGSAVHASCSSHDSRSSQAETLGQATPASHPTQDAFRGTHTLGKRVRATFPKDGTPPRQWITMTVGTPAAQRLSSMAGKGGLWI